MKQPLLEVSGLDRWIPVRSGMLGGVTGTVRAVDNVSFAIREGEVVGLVGESGSGKTTLARTILQLQRATRGSVYYDGQDLTKLSRSQLRPYRRHMQVVFQDPYSSLNPKLRVGEAIEEAILFHQLTRDRPSARAEVEHLFRAVGLSAHQASRYPHEFSGGQRQRIAIARALALGPRFIVADEPMSALDVSVQAQILNLFQDLREQYHLTMLFISHNLAVVRHLTDRIIVMYLGRVIEVADSASLFRTPRHPYTRALLSSAASSSPDRRIVLRGEIPSPLAPPSGCVFRTRCPYAVPACANDAPILRAVTPTHDVACIRSDLPAFAARPVPRSPCPHFFVDASPR